MKNRILTLCMIVSMSSAIMACGGTTDVTESPETPAVVDETQEDAAEVTDAETTDSAETADSAAEGGKYVAFTDASDAEVEAFAQKLVDATLAKDWNTIGDMISYPIGSKEENNLCNNKEEFVAYANSTGFDDEFFTTLSAWKVADLWGNWQGGCIADGAIWFNGEKSEDLKITSYLGIYGSDGEITE